MPGVGSEGIIPRARVRVPIRELTGFDEQLVSGEETASAVGLVDAILGGAPWPQAASLNAHQRDLLLGHLYRATFGDRIRKTATCAACGKPYDVDFPLGDLMSGAVVPDPSAAADNGDGTYTIEGGGRFRLPATEDELAVAGLSAPEGARELLRRCTIEPGDAVAIETAMERLAPILSLQLASECPECGTPQSVEFDLQRHFLAAVLSERRQTTLEIHRIALAYRWSMNEILGLPRSQRQSYYRLIDSERDARGMRER